jgi:hypothetical protein
VLHPFLPSLDKAPVNWAAGVVIDADAGSSFLGFEMGGKKRFRQRLIRWKANRLIREWFGLFTPARLPAHYRQWLYVHALKQKWLQTRHAFNEA